ncbi:hypothetical protein P3T27_003042 [Kitasatospora sp. MAA19]|uniref:hypothetical protein n=1 Tax=unclassified Kitasatospora TaxID=2633591 RepID=UPI002473A531|nr:hypothetical protein [Kitasatospora sp. MAA19]MDH6706319.1 hypothetical protein [Kitasatospora sp. MAA19]
MTMTCSAAVTAAIAAAAALAATGITYASAAASRPMAQPASAQQPDALVEALSDGILGWDDKGDGYESRGDGGRRFPEQGRVRINERSYSAYPGDCITVISGLGAKSLNIRNDSRRTVELYPGAVCDSGAPIATVGPGGSSDGVIPPPIEGISVLHGVVGSFRVVGPSKGFARPPR